MFLPLPPLRITEVSYTISPANFLKEVVGTCPSKAGQSLFFQKVWSHIKKKILVPHEHNADVQNASGHKEFLRADS